MKSTTREMLHRLNRCERGSALTEFTFFLPIWIMMMVAILSLGRIGIVSTQVQVRAQGELWSQVIPLTEPMGGDSESDDEDGAWVHAAPLSGYGHAARNYYRLGGDKSNPQRNNDRLEAVSSVAAAGAPVLGKGHHYVESYDRSVLPYTQPFHQEGIEATADPKEVLGDDDSRYAHKILNDGVSPRIDSSSPVVGIVEKLVKLTGALHHTGAGIQYGSVFADVEDDVELFGNWGTLHTEFHIDVLVPPRPLVGARAKNMPVAYSIVLAKGDEKYKHFLQWGKENWGGNSGEGEDYSQDVDQKIEDQKKKCDDAKKKHDKEQEESGGNKPFDPNSCVSLGGN